MKSIHQEFVDKQEHYEKLLGETLLISGVSGPLRIYQKANGHRHSIDDALTSCYAIQKFPTAKSALDLGSGIGSVGLAVLWGLDRETKLTCVEAQQISFNLLQANIACNDLSSRVIAIHKDLRELNLEQKFSLITASPPYFPLNSGVLPTDQQKAYARFELRGDLGDYARAAKRHLKENGLFVFCFPHIHKMRGEHLVQREGFNILASRAVKTSPEKRTLFHLYAASLDKSLTPIIEPELIVSNLKGEYSDEMLELQALRGFGQLGSNLLD